MSKPTKPKYFISPPDSPCDIEVVPACIAPVKNDITVRWGDCDPAQIAYTANIPKWALESIDSWYRQCLGIGWFEINLDYGVGTPFASIQFDFHAPIDPRDDMTVLVYVSRLGRTSLSHFVEATQHGKICWSGRTTAVFVETSNLQPLVIPPIMRAAIAQYIQNQNRQFELSSESVS